MWVLPTFAGAKSGKGRGPEPIDESDGLQSPLHQTQKALLLTTGLSSEAEAVNASTEVRSHRWRRRGARLGSRLAHLGDLVGFASCQPFQVVRGCSPTILDDASPPIEAGVISFPPMTIIPSITCSSMAKNLNWMQTPKHSAVEEL